MRQIYKDIVIGLILASFTFSPAAFAKPRAPKVRNVSKAPLYTNMVKTIKSNKRGLKVSDFVESAEPMIKKREFRDVRKMALPYWDKKFDKFTVGNDYFKIKFKGSTLFARYVDRGPVAFMVNNKPFLWKDFLIYGRAKARLTEIVMGKKAKKVSLMESLLRDVFPSAYAIDKDDCESIAGAVYEAPASCTCEENQEPLFVLESGRWVRNDVTCPPPGGAPPIIDTDDECPEGTQTNPDPTEVEEEPCVAVTRPGSNGKMNKWVLIGVGLLLLLLLLMKKKKKKKGTEDPPDEPTPGWTPEPEGQCPTPGARGLTEADLPPECRKSSCEAAGTCTGGKVLY